MRTTFRNPEFKHIIIRLLILQFVFVLGIICYVHIQMKYINKNIVNRDIALIGKVLHQNPNMEQQIIPLITKVPSIEDIKVGKKVLNEYGYAENMNIHYQPIFRDLNNKIYKIVILILLIYSIILFFIIKKSYDKMYFKIEKLIASSEKVIKGEFNIVLREDEEGDFSILTHQFNQMGSVLKNAIGKLHEDKLFLKNIISDISHQLKTPLSSLIMFNELLEDESMNSYMRKDFLNRSKLQLNKMEWLIINLLKMARLEAGAIEFKNEKFILVQAVKNVVKSFEYKLKRKNQKLNIIEEKENILVSGDRQWISEAILNVIKNCIEHTDVHGKIHISIDESPLFSRISIKDNGEGIEEKDLPHIFERFYKCNDNVKADSIGIGLALSKSIIESQSGEITVNSKKGIGTEFTITFFKMIF